MYDGCPILNVDVSYCGEGVTDRDFNYGRENA